ncbi:kinesin-like protein Klp5 [Tulasnella sp. JGI-2019a]|nr:kinesin-like protein Klp5 [Tulasnella sp. JGI-2019a]
MSQAASITVAVRVRPPTSWEHDRLPLPPTWSDFASLQHIADGTISSPQKTTTTTLASSLRPIIQVMDDHVLIFDPKDQNVSRSFEQRGFLPPGTKRYKDQRYTFDRVFDEGARQVDVFEKTTKPLLDGLLDGFNATVFAYGATGCGKTHTISGTEEDPGIIYLTMAELFSKIEEKQDDMMVEVSLSFLEIYNEEIRDLLSEPGTTAPRGGLQMREDKANRIAVSGLVELRPKTADEVKEFVIAGNARRTQSPTHANQTSSRSHAVLQINVAQTPRTASTTEERTLATLSIIDLAGSERASATRNMGERMVEGANINKSLLALGNCINALCESGNRTRHVPYRNSKLTRLLKFSLGGNCKTVMIVCIAPTSAHFEDTQNTLKYANRAKEIKTKVSRNFINVDRHVAQYVEAIQRLNSEVAELKARLAGKVGSEGEVARKRKLEAKAEMDRVRGDVAAKCEQTKASIVDGGMCEGGLAAAHARLSVVKVRLGQLDADAATRNLPADLEAERALLRTLVAADETTIKSGSMVQQRLTRTAMASSMFDAMVRAVAERKSDRMDDAMVDSIRTDARLKRAELDLLKSQTREGVLKDALCEQSGRVGELVGILARCTVMLRDGDGALRRAVDGLCTGLSCVDEQREEATRTVQAVAASLMKIAEGNDQAFHRLLGQSTTGLGGSGVAPSSLFNFTAHAAHRTSSRRSSLTRASLSSSTLGAPRSRRRSSMEPAPPSPAKRHRSPRKPSALRKSLAVRGVGGARHTLGSSSVAPAVEKKALRWKDQAGEGSLDDARQISPEATRAASKPSGSVSEAEWEDEPMDSSANDRTDDSFNHPVNPSKELSSSSEMVVVPLQHQAKPYTASTMRKSRTGRFDPGFLKPQPSTLGILAEAEDESLKSPSPVRRVVTPLGERSNQPLPELDLEEQRPCTPPPKSLRPERKQGGSTRKRRASIVGPLRVEKPKRRSSMIPQLSPPSNNPLKPSTRRMAVGDEESMPSTKKSPLRKTKRPSGMAPMRPSLSTAGNNNSMARSASIGGSGGGLLGKLKPWRPSLSVRLTPIVSSPGEVSGGDQVGSGRNSALGGAKRTWR